MGIREKWKEVKGTLEKKPERKWRDKQTKAETTAYKILLEKWQSFKWKSILFFFLIFLNFILFFNLILFLNFIILY